MVTPCCLQGDDNVLTNVNGPHRPFPSLQKGVRGILTDVGCDRRGIILIAGSYYTLHPSHPEAASYHPADGGLEDRQ